MDDQANILQQRIQIGTVGWHARQQAIKGTGRNDDEKQEPCADDTQNSQNPCQHIPWQLAGKQTDGKAPATENQTP